MEEERGNWFRFLAKKENYNFPGMIAGMIVMGLLTTTLVWLHDIYGLFEIQIPGVLHTVLGLVVGLLLVFRTNTAYDRWWEGRKQLGGLVNTCRNFTMQLLTLPAAEHYVEQNNLCQLVKAFPWTLKNHLRDQDYTSAPKYLPPHLLEGFYNSDHKPNFLLYRLNYHLGIMLRMHLIRPEMHRLLQPNLEHLTDQLGACERIRNTPIPLSYGLHLKRILFIYLFTAPIGFINQMDWWSIPTIMIIFYTMVGIELLGEEIEDPFGTDPNDLPFDEITAKIEANIDELLKLDDIADKEADEQKLTENQSARVGKQIEIKQISQSSAEVL
jgi:putative membrane protein